MKMAVTNPVEAIEIDAYVEAYQILKQRDLRSIKINCSKCGGVLTISPIVTNAYYKKNGVLQFDVDTINYCKNCSKI